MPTYEIINNLSDDVKRVLKDINLADQPSHADENYVLSCNEYIREVLSPIYGEDVVKKYLYDELLSQYVYQYFGALLYDCPYVFKEDEALKQHLVNRVAEINKIPQMEQRSEEWYKYRNDRITASDFASIFGKNVFKSKDQLLSDKIDPSSVVFISSDIMLHGTRLEDAICQMYQVNEGVEVKEYGCLSHDTIGHLGASPDGITDDGVMLEIKCPPKREIKGHPPVYYWCQMQLQLEVADLNRCDFVESKIEMISKDSFNELLKDEPTYRHEAGCLIECWNSEENKLIHDYFPVGNNLKDVDKWEDAYLNGLEGQEILDYRNTLYWHAKNYAKITIYRDRRWFQRRIPEINEFWEQVLEGREKLEVEKLITSDAANVTDTESFTSSSSKVSNTTVTSKTSKTSKRSKRSKKSVCLITNSSDSDAD